MSHLIPRLSIQWRASSALAWRTWVGIGVVGLLLLPMGVALRSIFLAPLFEEVVFRHGLHDALSMRLPCGGVRWAAALTALAFAGLHVLLASDARAWPFAGATAIPAWWIGTRYEQDRRLAPCVAWHAGFNLVWLGELRSLAQALTGS